MQGGRQAACFRAHVTPDLTLLRSASHAIDGGASVPEVKETLGHGNIATTSGYLHARPGSSSGLRLDEGVFLRMKTKQISVCMVLATGYGRLTIERSTANGG